jgi:hypothetical protein
MVAAAGRRIDLAPIDGDLLQYRMMSDDFGTFSAFSPRRPTVALILAVLPRLSNNCQRENGGGRLALPMIPATSGHCSDALDPKTQT